MTRVANFLKLIAFFCVPTQGKRIWEKTSESTVDFWANQPEELEMNEYLISLLPKMNSVSSILEVGCYTGQRLRAMGKLFPHAQLSGLEINSSATSRGNLDFESLGYQEKVITCGDIHDVKSLFPESFSIILSWAVLMYVHPLRIRSVLKSLVSLTDGALLIIEPAAKSRSDAFFPAKNRSFLHDYRAILNGFRNVDFELVEVLVPTHIWKPKFGEGTVFIVRKKVFDSFVADQNPIRFDNLK
jgi:hypothetical protein